MTQPLLGFLAIAPFVVACATTVGASDPSSLPEDAQQLCAAQCEELDMELDAVLVEKRSVGCECEPD